ncbi:replication protein, partial [Yersinia enterocolitica]
MNTAEILQFPSESGGQEKRVADTDDGFTRLANELYEELIGANLTRNQAKVAHAVCRKTYGFNKKMDRIADSQIALITRLPRQKVNKAKNELIAMKVLLKEGQLIGPNKSLSEWQIPECHLNNVSVTTVVTKDVTKTVTALSLKQGHTKDTITKDNKDIKKILPEPKKS